MNTEPFKTSFAPTQKYWLDLREDPGGGGHSGCEHKLCILDGAQACFTKTTSNEPRYIHNTWDIEKFLVSDRYDSTS